LKRDRCPLKFGDERALLTKVNQNRSLWHDLQVDASTMAGFRLSIRPPWDTDSIVEGVRKDAVANGGGVGVFDAGGRSEKPLREDRHDPMEYGQQRFHDP
jgi:hypothetical protein